MDFSPSFNVRVECLGGDSGHSYLIQSLIQNSLRRIAFLQGEDIFSLLPLVDMELVSSSNTYRVFLIGRFYPGVERFFTEILSRWLLPGQNLTPHFSLHSIFSLSQSPLEQLSFCEMRFLLQEQQDFESIRRSFSQVLPEIRLGAVSPYQAHKILERRGLFSSDKNSLIQERVASLIHKRPEDFDYDVFGQMQHFFLSSAEGFKQVREHPHLSRIVYVFYLFRRRLKRVTEKAPDKRHVSFKVSQVRLHQSFGLQRVLGIFVGINFLKKHELFEEHHLEKAIQEYIPDAQVVEGSLFVYLHKEERLQIIYLEIHKACGRQFSALEVQILRKRFPYALEHQVEKLMPALFMPRNEEEVMKNVIRLSQELKYLKDIPQVMISFEEQTDFELSFTIVLLRVLFDNEPSIGTLFKQKALSYSFIEDRVKQVGFMRGKYPKEATVFRLKLPKVLYMRGDHTVDLLKARQAVVEALLLTVGEFRDYNGGMIAKQAENLKAFKTLLTASRSQVELESFFHSIYPVEIRSVVDPLLLKSLYEEWQAILLQEESSSFDFSFSQEKEGMIFMTRFAEEEIKPSLSAAIKGLNLSSSQWILFSSKNGPYHYQGYLLLGGAREKGEQLIQEFQKIQDRICFIGS
jgi:hypothetical protein